MLTGLRWLTLEVKDLDRARTFYADHLGLDIHRADREESGTGEIVFDAGDTDLICRRPTGVPRGGIHTHFAFAVPEAEYAEWWDRLAADFDLSEMSFGDARSLYLYDPDGNCVELGESDVTGPGIDGIFEVVLEVTSLEDACAFYESLGFEPVDRGSDRKRVRLDGPMALELWEPQLGIADGRGGVHVDLGFETDDCEAVVDAIGEQACSIERTAEAIGICDPDGHRLTFQSSV